MKSHLLATLLGLFCHQMYSQTITPTDITLQTFYTGLANPVGVYHCGDDRLFVVEQNQGDIEIINTSGQYIGTFLDLTGLLTTGSERGLLGLAFHPDYVNNGYFYVNYTNLSGSTVVARYQVSSDPNVADPNSALILFTVAQPAANHNGGHLAFGPDGYLYIGMGDGGGAGDTSNRAQNITLMLGKILRIDVNSGSPYSIPVDNPFYGTAYRQEIWAVGTRNPWQFTFDRETGDMWVADVGQNLWEEIDFTPAGTPGGVNYGWRCYEGFAEYNMLDCTGTYTPPVAVFPHPTFVSITGGYVYRGQQYPGLNGVYFFSDYGNGDIYAMTDLANGSYASQNLYNGPAACVAFGEDYLGEMYVVNYTGTIYKIADVCGSFYPQISATPGTLNCTSATQYWWYQDGVELPGANGSSFSPSAAGTYYAVATDGTCTRQTNEVDWIVMGGVGGCTYANALNYQPEAQVDNGTCQFGTASDCPADMDGNGIIDVVDLSGFLAVFGSLCPH